MRKPVLSTKTTEERKVDSKGFESMKLLKKGNHEIFVKPERGRGHGENQGRTHGDNQGRGRGENQGRDNGDNNGRVGIADNQERFNGENQYRGRSGNQGRGFADNEERFRGGMRISIVVVVRIMPDRPDQMERVEVAGGKVINWNVYRVLGVLATSRSIAVQRIGESPILFQTPWKFIEEVNSLNPLLICLFENEGVHIDSHWSPGIRMKCIFGNFSCRKHGIQLKYNFCIYFSWKVVDIVASAPSRTTAARVVVDCVVRAWRIKFTTSKSDDCVVICLFLDEVFPSSQVQEVDLDERLEKANPTLSVKEDNDTTNAKVQGSNLSSGWVQDPIYFNK
ncbi:hypothetical protein IFM89_000309 [Coptis chinensis]|uniref:Uncharacterized protein n=1 Tax=Coptis chinensis TaxID=261450 RepID=A0A835LQ19_9MAGN|nr:hypothetical protein IFM89_000309 [Coptis chinensis]